nr:transglutaminase domain-containing protein [Ureibacillus chungkukjangi]
MLFIALCLVLSLFQIHFLISGLIKFAYIIWFIVFVYGGVFVLSAEGIDFLFNDFQTNIAAVLRADWLHITNPFRTFLFFILIWMLIYLIHHWIVVRMSVFYFLLLTVFFVGTLDTFTEYDGSFAIVRVMVLGLALTVFLLVKRLLKQANITLDLKKYLKLAVPAILLVFVMSSIAIYLPKFSPQWPDPVPFIKSATGQGGAEVNGGGISKVGYGENDSRLGGSFVADDTVVFLAESETKQYWRIETKDRYTSKGWEDSGYFQGELSVFEHQQIIETSLPVGPEEDTKTATVEVVNPYDFIIQPYGMKSVTSAMVSVLPNLEFMLSLDTEKIVTYVDRAPTELPGYTLEYSKPVYLYSTLKNPTEEIDPVLFERYLQLPDTLPTRVRDLAAEIVGIRETPYDKARAIEMYFKQNGFRYETDNVAIPSEEQDYVDQFLFDTKIGYCDNFSTSMVVLLRSLGIPARWVKGFAGGDVIDNHGSSSTYQITNNDAHSWVEAYIPNVGWMNFEPTIGFNNSRSIEYDLSTDDYEEEVLTVEEETEPDEKIEKETEPKKTAAEESQFFENIAKFFEQNKYILIGILLLALVGAFILYKIRRKWLPKVYGKLYRRKELNESRFEASFLQLLKLLEMKGFKRKEGQTLQAFAKEVDSYFENGHMSLLTAAYEQTIYSKDASAVNVLQMRESWEYLINQITS